MRVIHAADVHLGRPLGGLDAHADLPVEQVRKASTRAFARLARLCAERSVDVLLLAGDLFDREADLVTLREAARVLKAITDGGTRAVAIRGNHDAASRMQRNLPALVNFYELPVTGPDSVIFDDLGIAIHGRGFETVHVAENIVHSYPAPRAGMFNVGLLHTSLSGSNAHGDYAPCSLDDLQARGYQYWALGHIHMRRVVCDSPWVVYPGCLQGQDIGECGPHGAMMFDVEGGEVVGCPEFVALDEVRWHRCTVELAPNEDAGELRERIGVQLREIVDAAPEHVHIVRLVVTGRGRANDEISGNLGAWRASLHEIVFEISGERLYLEQVRMQTLPQLPDRAELLAREDFIGDVARELLARGTEDADDFTDAFTVLERKLKTLPPDVADELRAPPSDVEGAREQLLGRLLVAAADDAEAATR